jgi:thiosulfate/3-mercaptopyruvate sulfurtransferase
VSSDAEGKAYHEGHIPGAVFWFWKDALWHETDREFTTPREMAKRLGAIGVSPETTVVLYGDPVQYGTYALWVLMMTGHSNVRLLDGSRTRWAAEGRPLTTEIPLFVTVSHPRGDADVSSRLGRNEVRERLGEPGQVLLDVRSPEEYRGERVSPPGGFDHGAERTGRIPGAVHLFYRELLNDDDTFLSIDQLREKFTEAGVESGTDDEVVTYCRLSHRATLAWFAITQVLGIEDAKIYDGSWTEWGSIVGFPVERDIA